MDGCSGAILPNIIPQLMKEAAITVRYNHFEGNGWINVRKAQNTPTLKGASYNKGDSIIIHDGLHVFMFNSNGRVITSRR